MLNAAARAPPAQDAAVYGTMSYNKPRHRGSFRPPALHDGHPHRESAHDYLTVAAGRYFEDVGAPPGAARRSRRVARARAARCAHPSMCAMRPRRLSPHLADVGRHHPHFRRLKGVFWGALSNQPSSRTCRRRCFGRHAAVRQTARCVTPCGEDLAARLPRDTRCIAPPSCQPARCGRARRRAARFACCGAL